MITIEQRDTETRGHGDAETAPALPSPRPPVAASPRLPSASPWIDLTEAARRSGKNEGHLRRLCSSTWLAAGKAREISGSGKRRRWQVTEDADPSFARVKFPEHLGQDLRQVSQAKREEAVRRKKILDGWWEYRRAGLAMKFSVDQITAQYLNHLEAENGKAPSRPTLFGWEKRFRSGGLAALVDQRGAAAAEKPADPFLDEVKRLYLSVRKLKLTVCREIAILKSSEQGWTPRSLTTCQRFIAAVPQAVVLKYRFGDEAFVNQAEPYIERDYSTLQSNEIWCGDHHQFDVIINHGGKHCRPWITAWEDVRSRKIVGYQVFAHDPNGDTILAAFRSGCLDAGVPQRVYIDNGKDYDSYALQGRTKADRWAKRSIKASVDVAYAGGIFSALGVDATFAWAYHGQSKLIERFFTTIEMWTPVWDTYCGNKTSEKPQDLQQNLERGKAPSLAEFSQWFDGLMTSYHQTAHTGDAMDGKSPNTVFAECLHSRRTATPELLDVLLLKPTKPMKVGQNGVMYNGLRYGQHDLMMHHGREVILRVDNRDLSRVQVWSIDGKFVCMAHANSRVPANATSAELREAINAKRKASKVVKEYHQARPRLHEDLPDLITRAKANAARIDGGDKPDPSLPPPSIVPVRSAIEGELPSLRRAFETGNLRKAVGAEGATRESTRFIYQPTAEPAEDVEQSSSMSFRDFMPEPQPQREHSDE